MAGSWFVHLRELTKALSLCSDQSPVICWHYTMQVWEFIAIEIQYKFAHRFYKCHLHYYPQTKLLILGLWRTHQEQIAIMPPKQKCPSTLPSIYRESPPAASRAPTWRRDQYGSGVHPHTCALSHHVSQDTSSGSQKFGALFYDL